MKPRLQIYMGLSAVIVGLVALPTLARADNAPSAPAVYPQVADHPSVFNSSASASGTATPDIPNPPRAADGTPLTGVVAPQSPAAASSGAPSTPPSGNYPGTGSSPQKGVVPAPYAPSPATPATASAGAPSTPVSGNYPGSGSSPQKGIVPPPYAPSPVTPAADSAGAIRTPVTGNYPGSGSSPPPIKAPQPPPVHNADSSVPVAPATAP